MLPLRIALAGLLVFGDPFWRTKPVAAWSPQEARELLDDSPWSKASSASIARLQTEDERRDGGNMGQPHGVGYDGIGRIPRGLRLLLRWETALPVRLAELKAGEIEPPTLPGDGYRLAVYGIPGGNFKGDPKSLGAPLREAAALKREGRKEVRPSSVEVFSRPDGAVVVYLFPLSAELTKKDGLIEISARIGRIGIDQFFDAAEMEFQGKLEI